MRTMIKKKVLADGTVRHQAYARRGGKKAYVGTYDTERQAEEAEEEFRVTQRKIERGELPPDMDERVTIAAASSTWVASLLMRNSRSHDGYGWIVDNLIIPKLGALPASSLTKKRVLQWRDDLATRYAAASVNTAMGALSSFLSSLVEGGSLPSNPCRGIRPLPVPDRAYLWIRTVPEMERLIRSCTGSLRDLVAVALGTGMRIDEILHLQWVDVDLDRRLLTVQRGRRGTPKGGMRHVPILDAVMPVLQQLALQRGGAVLVFPSRTKRVRAKGHVTKSFKEALARAELDQAIRFHDLRHTFASHWVMNGGDIFRLSKVLGHKSVSVTQKFYAHLIPEVWQQDYRRVTFSMPTEAAVYRFPVGVTAAARGEKSGRRHRMEAATA